MIASDDWVVAVLKLNPTWVPPPITRGSCVATMTRAQMLAQSGTANSAARGWNRCILLELLRRDFLITFLTADKVVVCFACLAICLV